MSCWSPLTFALRDVHFRSAWHPATVVGHRCLTRGLSDIAAMGGEPLACFLSLGLPEDLSQAWVNGFLRGAGLARRFNVQLAGGDISSAAHITADIIVTGHVPSGKAVLVRAQPGRSHLRQRFLGGSAATVKQLFAGKSVAPTKASPIFTPLLVLKWGTAAKTRPRNCHDRP